MTQEMSFTSVFCRSPMPDLSAFAVDHVDDPHFFALAATHFGLAAGFVHEILAGLEVSLVDMPLPEALTSSSTSLATQRWTLMFEQRDDDDLGIIAVTRLRDPELVSTWISAQRKLPISADAVVAVCRVSTEKNLMPAARFVVGEVIRWLAWKSSGLVLGDDGVLLRFELGMLLPVETGTSRL